MIFAHPTTVLVESRSTGKSEFRNPKSQIPNRNLRRVTAASPDGVVRAKDFGLQSKSSTLSNKDGAAPNPKLLRLDMPWMVS